MTKYIVGTGFLLSILLCFATSFLSDKPDKLITPKVGNAPIPEIAELYIKGKVVGWPGEIVAEDEYDLVKGYFKEFKIEKATRSAAGRRMMLPDVVKKVLGKYTDNYRQEIGDCFVKGTKILMADGSEKNIEDVQVGEVVLNHMSKPRTVTHLVRKKFTGDLVTIKLKGWHRELTATETHDGLYLPYKGYRFNFSGFDQKKFGEYQVGDYLMLPFGLETPEDAPYIVLDLKDYVKDVEYDNTHVWRNHSKPIKRFVTVDEKFGRLMGLYLSEGGAHSGATSFSFNSNELEYIQNTKDLIKEIFGVEASSYMAHKDKDTCVKVTISSVIIDPFFKSLVPGDLYHKTVNPIFFKSRPSVRRAVLVGWMDGDGNENGASNRLTGVTAAVSLASDMNRLCLSLRINPKSLVREKEEHQRVPSLQVDIYGLDCLKIYPDFENVKPYREIKIDRIPGGFARKISNISRTPVVDYDVFCVTVEGEHTVIAANISQKNCVSFGAKNAIEYLQCTEMLMAEKHNKFQPIFPPYLYGTGRVLIGGGRLNGDGSLGSWQAAAVIKYGSIRSNEKDVPAYAGSVAKKWGDPPGPPKNFVEIGSKHLVKSAAKINSWDDLVAAIVNGYPCTVASDQGFTMEAGSDGFHKASGSWAHQMCIVGVDDEHATPYALIVNSWGDSHGHLKDFKTGEDLPVGIIRAKKDVIERMIKQGECFAFSNFDGFPEQLIDEKLFKVAKDGNKMQSSGGNLGGMYMFGLYQDVLWTERRRFRFIQAR